MLVALLYRLDTSYISYTNLIRGVNMNGNDVNADEDSSNNDDDELKKKKKVDTRSSKRICLYCAKKSRWSIKMHSM